MNLLDSIFGALPEHYRPESCIAGGFAACPYFASYIDIFVLNGGERRHAIARVDIRNYLRILAYYYREHPHIIQYSTGSSYQTFTLVPTGGPALPIHIILSDHPTVADLLRAFDISAHTAAITSDGYRHTIDKTTGIVEKAHITDVEPVSQRTRVLQRYRKIYLPQQEPDHNEL